MASLGDLLITNRSPTSEERERLKQLVADYDDILDTISNKISRREAQLQSLKDEKTAVLEAVAPYRKALSPFRYLPEDVIREIFVACLETRRNPTMANTEAPVLLTQICSVMRRVALSTPALWAAIHIPVIGNVSKFKDEAQSVMSRRAEGAKEWLLRRSGTLPLSISFYEPLNDCISYQNPLATEMVDILIAYCSRWRNVDLTCGPDSLSRISTLTPSDVPLLQSLSITNNYSSFQSPRELRFWSEFKILQTPSLKQISFVGANTNLSDYPLKWSNITHLRIPELLSWAASTSESKGNLVKILQQTTRLVNLHVDVPEMGEYFNVDKISLPFLTSLVITDCHSPHAENEGFLAFIDAPALEAVMYNMFQGVTCRPVDLIGLLRRSPNLQELSMGIPESSDTLVECLRHCPSLSILHIQGTGYKDAFTAAHDAFLNKFVLDDITQCICPRLEYFRCDSGLEVSFNALHDFFMRKKGVIPHLSCWKVIAMNVKYDPIEEPIMKKLCSEELGGDIELRLSCKKRCHFVQALDRGITASDDWWPSRVGFPTGR